MGKLLYSLVLLLCSAPTLAGQLYRCGNSFQQTPCDGNKAGAMEVKESMAGSSDVLSGSAQAGKKEATSKNKKLEHALEAAGGKRAGKGAKKSRPRKITDCPTALEIRNAKVGANSIMLSKQERTKRLQAIKKMERCARE